MGSIVTFYSYKGGVGRSMVLANTGVLLAREGVRVLAIDWDLEAPGLERYFHYYDIETDGNGLVPMLGDFRNRNARPYADYAWSIDVGRGKPLTFMSSGRDKDPLAYARQLEHLNWQEFFFNGGGDYLEDLREQWKRDFDLVLIDSRTGLSDTGGICTIQLPDIVVAMFTPSFQSLLGARDVMRYAKKARQALAYPRMELTVLPLLARFSSRTEISSSIDWIDRCASEVAEFYEDWLPAWVKAGEVLQRLHVPQVDYFGFGENLAVEEQGIAEPGGIGSVCYQLSRILRENFRDAHDILQLRERVSEDRASRRLEDEYEWDIYVSYAQVSYLDEWVQRLIRQLEDSLAAIDPDRTPAIFFQRRELAIGSTFPDTIGRALQRSRLLLPLLTPEYARSAWSIAEWRTFAEREALLSRGTSLIFPVMLRKLDLSARQDGLLLNRSYLDMTDLIGTIPRVGTRAGRLFDRRVEEMAIEIAARLEAVPPFSRTFPLVEPDLT